MEAIEATWQKAEKNKGFRCKTDVFQSDNARVRTTGVQVAAPWEASEGRSPPILIPKPAACTSVSAVLRSRAFLTLFAARRAGKERLSAEKLAVWRAFWTACNARVQNHGRCLCLRMKKTLLLSQERCIA